MHYARMEKLVPEDWRWWQYQLDVATHACSSKHSALLEIVERLEFDEVSTETKKQMEYEQSEWIVRTQSEMFSVMSLLTKGEVNQLVEQSHHGHVQPEDAGEPCSSMARCHQTQGHA